MEKLNDIFFYSLEKAIKSYRQFAQKQINAHDIDITIDQWLVLKAIHEDPSTGQNSIAEKIFKNEASVTRIIDLLIQKKYLTRNIDEENRRKNILNITKKGQQILSKLQPIIKKNRTKALQNCLYEELATTHLVLKEIINNCSQ